MRIIFLERYIVGKNDLMKLVWIAMYSTNCLSMDISVCVLLFAVSSYHSSSCPVASSNGIGNK